MPKILLKLVSTERLKFFEYLCKSDGLKELPQNQVDSDHFYLDWWLLGFFSPVILWNVMFLSEGWFFFYFLYFVWTCLGFGFFGPENALAYFEREDFVSDQ